MHFLGLHQINSRLANAPRVRRFAKCESAIDQTRNHVLAWKLPEVLVIEASEKGSGGKSRTVPPL